MIELEQPAWLALPVILAIIYALYLQKLSLQNSKHYANIVSVYLPFNFKSYSISPHHHQNKHILNWILILLMSISLSQPVKKTRIATNPEKLQDIFFIIDTSVGMSIRDYSIEKKEVDRLSLVKALLINFVSQLKDNRIGTMVYADNAYILTPLSRDKELVINNIKRIRPAIAGRRNNMGNALSTFLEFSKTLSTKPAVIVLSQGANLDRSHDMNELVKLFNAKNIRLHFIGMGSDSKKQTSTNKLIYDPIDKAILSILAKNTGGEFYWAGKQGDMETTLSSIKSSETTLVKTKEIFQTEHYYMWPLYLFISLVFIKSIFLFVKRGFS